MDEKLIPIWDLADRMRLRPQQLDLPTLVREAQKEGVAIGWEQINPIASRFGEYGTSYVPSLIVSFLKAYLAERNIQKALDSWAGYGVLLNALVEEGIVKAGVGICHTSDELEIARLTSPSQVIDWLRADPINEPIGQAGSFDLVVSVPPFGQQIITDNFPTDEGVVTVRDHRGSMLSLISCLLLPYDGEGILVVPPMFFRKQSTNVYNSLPKLGLHVHSVIALSSRTFPTTSFEPSLVFLGREKPENLFVAQLTPDQDLEPLLENMRQRRPGRVRELGRLIDPKKFRSWRSLALDEEIGKLSSRSSLPSVPLADIASEINLKKRTGEMGFESKTNAVYLPLLGTSAAVTSLSDLQIKQQNYAQIVLQPDSASAEYVAGFFNSDLGRLLRTRLSQGGAIPKMSKQKLQAAILFLPPLEIQNRVVEAYRTIRDFKLQLQNAESKLWRRPFEVMSVSNEIQSLNRKNSFEDWIEALPFPLASVLWRYRADSDLHLKINHLFNFFEALAQFLCTVMLSAFQSNTALFHQHLSEWFEGANFKRSSFGTWVTVGQRLAKATRRMLSDENDRINCLEMYSTRSTEWIESMVDKGMYKSLATANKYRNDWKGHGGIASERERTVRLEMLENELSSVRNALGSSIEQVLLITPGKSEYRGGVFDYSASSLTGTRTIFRQITVETLKPMETGKLYLLDESIRTPLEIVPFFRLMPSPKSEENACYFYNRVDKQGVRWVSYHFEQEADVTQPDPEVLDLLALLEQS